MWCNKAKQQLTPDLFAKWYAGQLLTTAEKQMIFRALAIKWGLRDSRACNRKIDQGTAKKEK